MKRLLSIVILAATTIIAWADPTISFVEKSHDFGNINEADGPVTYTFRFTNDGDKPLVIISAKSECGCTKPKYPMQPIAPGSDSAVSVTFDPVGYAGEFMKDIKVRTNDKKHRIVRLRITGVVIPERPL